MPGQRWDENKLIFLLPFTEDVCGEKSIVHGNLIISLLRLHEFHNSEETDVS